MAEDSNPDPLWLNSPIKRTLLRGIFYLLPVLLLGLVGRVSSGSWWGGLGGALGACAIVIGASKMMERALAWLLGRLRVWQWRAREGQHYSFGGVSLTLHDDGRHLWLHETGLRRLLGLRDDPPDAFKARFSRHWRESRELGLQGKGLWLEAAAVHRYLAQAPDRMNPARLRLRNYLDREILQPAARRHARGR
jgi:hypothetical protein